MFRIKNFLNMFQALYLVIKLMMSVTKTSYTKSMSQNLKYEINYLKNMFFQILVYVNRHQYECNRGKKNSSYS